MYTLKRTNDDININLFQFSNTITKDDLINFQKDFDLILFPNKRHGYGDMSNYMMRRKWDYFVKYLKGVEPPKEFSFD